MNEGLTIGKREQKHLCINNSIDRMSIQVTLLEELVCKIGGIPGEQPAQIHPEIPSLLDFLDGAPEELNLLTDRLAKVIEDLHSMLF